jgi:hypothetical protein
MMTRKDYVEVAKILSNHNKDIPPATFQSLIFHFAQMFYNDNSRFDTVRFENAVKEN